MDQFKTVSKNRSDVHKYLKNYFNYDFPKDLQLTADDIFSILKDHMQSFSFSKYLKNFIADKFPEKFNMYDDDSARTEAMISFCIDAFRDSGMLDQKNIFSRDKKIITDELLRKQVRNWLGGVTPSRESIFLLAFALKMDCDELSDFLANGIHDKKLNYKNPAEVTAFACLNKAKSYRQAEELLRQAAEKAPYVKESGRNFFTSEYEALYEKIDTEEKLVSFIAELITENNDPKTSKCIKVCYDELIKKIYKNAAADKMISVANETGIEISLSDNVSFGTVERYIYYYIPVKSEKGYFRTDTYAPYANGNIMGKQNNYFKDSKWFFSTLLRRSDLKKMFNGQKAISRDTILTLAFFAACEDESDCDVYEYIMEINDQLCYCRFEQINFAYPYDLFIFMCLQTDDPLSCFRKIWKYSWIK